MFWPSLRLARMVAPGMRARKSGVIMMISSIYGRELGGPSSYQVVKSAQLTKSLLLRSMAICGNPLPRPTEVGSKYEGPVWMIVRERENDLPPSFEIASTMPLMSLQTT